MHLSAPLPLRALALIGLSVHAFPPAMACGGSTGDQEGAEIDQADAAAICLSLDAAICCLELLTTSDMPKQVGGHSISIRDCHPRDPGKIVAMLCCIYLPVSNYVFLRPQIPGVLRGYHCSISLVSHDSRLCRRSSRHMRQPMPWTVRGNASPHSAIPRAFAGAPEVCIPAALRNILRTAGYGRKCQPRCCISRAPNKVYPAICVFYR